MKEKQKLIYTIYGLLFMRDGKVRGAMSPVCFADETSKALGEPYNRLGRISFNDYEVHNEYEKGEGLTGYDTLILAYVYENDIKVTLFVDMGCNGMPVALMFKNDTEPTITPVYQKTKRFERKLEDAELKELFQYIFDNFNLLDIKEAA